MEILSLYDIEDGLRHGAYWEAYMVRTVLFACAGLCLATQASAAPVATSSSDLSSRPGSAPMLGGAYLGMTLGVWKTLPRPPSLSANAIASCTEKSAAGDVAGARQAAVEPGGPVVCSYLARYGAVTLAQSLRLTSKYLARNPQYTFADGRLSAIRFLASTDAFDSLMAQFSPAYGAPMETMRDNVSFGGTIRLPRVQKVWRVGDQWLRITDPAERPDRLEVELTTARPAGIPVS
jgi:hypothetical protein